MPFTGIQLKPEEPFELALPAGMTFVLCQAALARPAKVGFTAAISVRCADGPETIICMLCKGREQWSCVGRPFTFDRHDKAIISVTGAIVDVLGQMVITAEDIDSPTKGEQSESDDSDGFGSARSPSTGRKRRPQWDETGNTICLALFDCTHSLMHSQTCVPP